MKKILKESALTVGTIWLVFVVIYVVFPRVRVSLWFDLCFVLIGIIGPAVHLFTSVTSHLRRQRAAAKGIDTSGYIPACCYVGGLADYKDISPTAKYAVFLNSKDQIWVFECDDYLASPSRRNDFWEHVKTSMSRIPKAAVRAIGVIEQSGEKVADSRIASAAKTMAENFTVGQLFRYSKERLVFASYLLVEYVLDGVSRTASFGIPYSSRQPSPIDFIKPLSPDEISALAQSAGIACHNLEVSGADAPVARNCRLIAHELLRWKARQ
ncbi:MAG: hypothetical protein WC378_18915 [Opitutaceae bacterium]|jgi:hypothetical protein